ncbi:MAG: FtsX-like permease family protein, partial [Olsenella sp.]
MFFRLALGNVRKSARDYAVYFITLVLGVAVFYAFNTISDQASFLSTDAREMVQAVGQLMLFVTVFLAFVLGFLMVYANNYLVKRRKQEFGLYQLLGMTRAQVSLVLFLETALASLASFVVGLLTGVLLSQLLVFVTAALFNDRVTNFTFHFSSFAALFTLGCFVLIFVVMLAFNLRMLRKVDLADLMSASRKNEQVRVRSLPATIVLGLVGVGLIGWAYYRLTRDGLPLDGTVEFPPFLVTT